MFIISDFNVKKDGLIVSHRLVFGIIANTNIFVFYFFEQKLYFFAEELRKPKVHESGTAVLPQGKREKPKTLHELQMMATFLKLHKCFVWHL